MTDDLGRKTGARAGQKPRVGPPFDQMPWRQPVNPDRPLDPLDAEGVQAIHATAMRILSEIGIEFPNPDAVAILVRAGCKVAGENVRMGEDFVMEMLGHAPASVVLTPRNPDHAVMIGSKHMAFVTVSSPPISWDMERGKQSGEFATFKEFIKLTQYFNCIHIAGGYPVEPIDIPPSVRHLDCLNAMLTLTDKVVHAYSLGAARVEDVMEMTRLAGGLSQAEFDAKPRMYTNINSVSPLKHDCLMLDGAMRLARRGQPVIVTPFMLAGATAPVTLAGAVALGIAEAVSAIALLQYINPGCPAAIGAFTSNVNLKTGAPAYGTPDYMRATQMIGQMARFYGLPLRSSGGCAAAVPDGQAMWETSNSLWAAVQSGANMVYHAAGWLDCGLIASPEKFIMDCEVLQMIQRYCEAATFATREENLAFELIKEVGAGGHYSGTQHLPDRTASAIHAPIVSDWRTYETMPPGAEIWSHARAHAVFKQIMADFKAPDMNGDHQEDLARFVAMRKQEGGVS